MREGHDVIPLPLDIAYRNNGVPINPVSTDKGISFGARERAIISTIIIKIAPSNNEAGSTFLLSPPKINLTILGMTRPIHPTVPAIETEDAEIGRAHV